MSVSYLQNIIICSIFSPISQEIIFKLFEQLWLITDLIVKSMLNYSNYHIFVNLKYLLWPNAVGLDTRYFWLYFFFFFSVFHLKKIKLYSSNCIDTSDFWLFHFWLFHSIKQPCLKCLGAWWSMQYSCLENHLERGTWQAAIHRVAKSQAQLKQLGTHTTKGHIQMHRT